MFNNEKLRNPVIRDFMTDHFNYAARLVYLGAPVVEDVDKIVTVANMKVGAYTIAAQPDVPRNITVTHAQVGGVTDTLGTIVIVGTNYKDKVITETLTPGDGALVVGTKAFKTVVSATGAGWVINTTEDTITIGVGALIGMPFVVVEAADVLLGILGVTITAVAGVTVGAIEVCVVSLSAGTYNGTKKMYIFVVE